MIFNCYVSQQQYSWDCDVWHNRHLDLKIRVLTLSFSLFYEDGQHLPSVLQFYHTETGTDSKEIFAAALPTLLDEIICFPGESDHTETDRR
jgi:hypothetical protein